MTDLYDFSDHNSVASYEDDRISISSDLPPNSPVHRPLSGISTRGPFSRSGSISKRGRNSRRASNSGASISGGDAGGLGCLADELAGAWGDDYDEGEEEEGDDVDEGYEGDEAGEEGYNEVNEKSDIEGLVAEPEVHDLSYHLNCQINEDNSGRLCMTGELKAKPGKASLLNRRDYDGSNYGDPENLTDGISPSLQAKLEQIERLAVAGKKSLKTAAVAKLEVWSEDGRGVLPDDPQDINDVIPRLVDGLQKLQPQSSLETSCTRLVTAHAALSSHIYSQSRTLRELSFSLLSSPIPAPEDTTDIILTLADLIPRPNYHLLSELSSLHDLTSSLISQLSFLSDSLHMARQSSILANRKLRSAKEACNEWKSELEQAERSRRWIEEGGWEERCKSREAGRVCGEVIEGFREACSRYEEKMQALLVSC